MITKRNRMMVKSAKKSLHYCGCDRNMISPGEKCSVCGHIDKKGKRRFKKDTLPFGDDL